MGTFGKQLFKLRDKTGLSQTEFGTLIGLSRNSIYNYENDKRTPSLEDIIKIADHFHVSTDWLLRGATCKDADDEEIHKVTGLSEKAIERLKRLFLYREQVFVASENRMLKGSEARDYINNGVKSNDIVVTDLRISVINKLLEDDLGLLDHMARFLFFKYQLIGGINATINTHIRGQNGITVCIEPENINKIHLSDIQDKLYRLREKIIEEGESNVDSSSEG